MTPSDAACYLDIDVANLFPFRRKIAQPRLRLLCLPFAGGSASLYRSWSGVLPPTIEVCPVELPGRGVRHDEPTTSDMRQLVESIAAATDWLGSAPIALFGHSMGARIAFELARQLDGRVIHLFVAGSPPPEVSPSYPGDDTRPTEQLTDHDLKQRLRNLGGTPTELLADDELMRRAMPIVRADLVLIERYQTEARARVACPLTVIAGAHDVGATPPIAAAWRLRTAAASRLVELDAGHFFLDSHRAAVIREILHDLAPHLA